MAFGNVNVDYKPCKSVAQLKSAADYMLGKQKKQIQSGTIKTSGDLYTALGCNRDNFANSIMVTRKLNGKSYSRIKANEILAHKMSISFHPDDNVDYITAYRIAKDFAERFAYRKGYEVLFAVHTDTDHVHAHFLISNCSMENGKSYRRSQSDLYEMSKYFGEQCLAHGFLNSVRENFYNKNPDKVRDKKTFAETQIKKRGAESFKDELREAVQIELADPRNRTFDDIIRALKEHYNVECRVAGNTISYRHPKYLDKNGKPVSVRGSRLGDLYTRKGIEYELTKKRTDRSADLESAAAELRKFVGADVDNASGQRTIGRGQIPSGAAAHNGQQTLREASGFYEQDRNQINPDQQQPTQNTESARAVQKRNRRHRR